jgi:hypothetical protein
MFMKKVKKMNDEFLKIKGLQKVNDLQKENMKKKK